MQVFCLGSVRGLPCSSASHFIKQNSTSVVYYRVLLRKYSRSILFSYFNILFSCFFFLLDRYMGTIPKCYNAPLPFITIFKDNVSVV